ncbi:MAG: DUF4838 domain-containing protein [Planctomycetes bacterium]|nr:DUF4838 domain-containing protein [Planctomycetota bacterium]
MNARVRRPLAAALALVLAPVLVAITLAAPVLSAEAPPRPVPPGPHVTKTDPTSPSTSFRKDQPIAGTYYFYWYDSSTKEHFVDGDGTDALTDHPDRPDGYSYRSVDWHHRELLDVLDAGLDFILPVYWGYPRAYDEWSFVGIPPLVEAARRLEKAGKTPPRIGLFYDTSTLRHNRHGFHADLATPEGKEWLYVSARDFYSLVPPDLRAAVDGRPIVWLYSAAFAKRQDPAALDQLRSEFAKDFGVEPFVVKEVSWQGRADATYAWGAALRPSILGVAGVGPGYDHSAVPGRAPLVREREGGELYRRSWETVLSLDPARRPKIAVVETWNELHEGTEIAPTVEHGRKYVELTRKHADLWRAGKRLERPGAFARTLEVSVVLGAANEPRGLVQADHEDGRTKPVAAVAGKAGRRAVPGAGGGRYVYFDVDDSFYLDDAQPVDVEIDYLDEGKGPIVLEYDSSDGAAAHGGAFKPLQAAVLEGTGAWRTVRVALADPAFAGRSNGHDFRLSAPGGGLVLGAVAVRKRSAVTAAVAGAAPVVLAASGKALGEIVVAKDATEPERHAAEELRRALKEVTGADFPLRSGDAAPAGDGPAILVGPGACAGVVSAEEIAGLGQEGYVLRTKGAQLAIAGGRPRGTLYGVYSLLEDEVGCRWLTPDVSRIPKRDPLEVRPLDRQHVPRLEHRSTDYPNSRDADWAARNKLNGTQTRIDPRRGGKVAYGPFVHTFNSILSSDEHFEKHPEWFSEVKGKRTGGRSQLCLTNPEVLRIATETVRRWMREQPEATIFSVSQNDWHNYCTCKECSRVTEEEGSPAGVYLRFVNAIADELRDEFPDKAVDTLAYQFTRKPPRLTRPRPNVIVRLCSIECCFAHPLGSQAALDPENAAFARDLEGWSRLSDRLYIWDYVINYAHSIMPFPNLYSLRPNIAFFADHGVRGIYEEANYFSRGGELAELRTWILAKTLWDPAYDTDRAIDEFLEGYYVEAARPLRRYVDLVHGKARMDGVHFHIFDGPGSALFAGDFVQRAEGLFDEAEKAVAENPAALHRVQTARLPVSYVRMARLLAKAREGKALSDDERRDLAGLFERFDAAARKEEIAHVSEGRGYDSWVQSVRKALEPAPEPAGGK